MEREKNENTIRMIQELTDAAGASGFEDEVILTAKKYGEEFAQTEEDCLRNLYLYRRKITGNKPVMMLDAHSDEVGLMVHSIKPNGTLRFVTLGRWTDQALPASKVLVRNRYGKYIPGIVASKPPHFMTPAERQAGGSTDIQSLVIDVGAVSKEDAVENFGIRIGEPVVPDVSFTYDEQHDIMMGKGFDCRIGCAALIESMRRLAEEELAVDLVGVLSSQEEVGERGVRVAVNKVAPQIALCFEGCPADDTFTEPYAIQTALKKGPMLRFMDCSVICSPRYQRYVLDLAEEKHLAVQASVREGGGNNGAIINTAMDGIPAIVVGVPVRYIHSPNGITSYYDFEATVQLAVEVVRSMSEEVIRSF